ncbi:Arginine/serine-rich-splicing factor RSP40 [Morus notabilis]|uniref:Arginine/serine-rich-splicing factor RSP40 n=1 Tax=Morus notabilis TaxID=981085 RepID=W9S7E2_9ROSA|nr:Arginine/serine-rich-splicing factor RSP40 [Morus notabilis]
MSPERCAACKYLRRKCPPECILSPYFPPNDPRRFACVHRIYGASNVVKMLQQLKSHDLRARAANSLYFEAQRRIEDPVYGCVRIITQLHQQIHNAETELAKMRAEIALKGTTSTATIGHLQGYHHHHHHHYHLYHHHDHHDDQLLEMECDLYSILSQGQSSVDQQSHLIGHATKGKMRPIFCGNFEYDARQSDLERLFGRYGKVDRVDMKSGFAFIYMEDDRDAEDAIRALDRREFGRKGRRLRVEWTKQERGIRRPGGSKKSSANNRPSKTLFVINFDPYHTRTKDLERHFDQYGKIVSVRIRRNFAFVQYESQEDATKALEATNMSKLMDRVISVEYAVRDDDERKDGYSPDRSRDRSLERGRDRRRSPSPYRRERGSPDYGRGSSPGAYRRERGSPDYGRGRSPSPYKKERASPDYGRGRSPSPYRRERAGADHGRGSSRSPNRREKVSADRGHGPSHSPYRREKVSADRGRDRSRSPYGRERGSPDDGRDPSASPYRRRRASPENGRGPSHSPLERERAEIDNGREPSPNSVPDPRDSPNYGGPESPMNERYQSMSRKRRHQNEIRLYDKVTMMGSRRTCDYPISIFHVSDHKQQLTPLSALSDTIPLPH